MRDKEIELLFPNLAAGNYFITSPKTTAYNCIAWAAEDQERWWWPDSLGIYYWPKSAPRSETLDAFITAYKTLGYQVCYNGGFEHGFKKIAIYVGENGKPSHAARLLSPTQWTSKLGRLYDIAHEIGGVSGTSYGQIAVFMKKSHTE